MQRKHVENSIDGFLLLQRKDTLTLLDAIALCAEALRFLA